MSARPYMQLYISDYFGDTAHLTTEQHGAYLLILMGMWKAGGYLLNDPSLLGALAKVEPRRWPAVARIIMPFFTVLADGTITQKRLEKEARKAATTSEQKRVASQQGVLARALVKTGIHQPRGKPKLEPSGQPPGEPNGQHPVNHPIVEPINLSHKEKEMLSSDGSELQPRASLQRTQGARSLAAASEVVTPTPNRSGAPYPVSAALEATIPRLTHSRRPL